AAADTQQLLRLASGHKVIRHVGLLSHAIIAYRCQSCNGLVVTGASQSLSVACILLQSLSVYAMLMVSREERFRWRRCCTRRGLWGRASATTATRSIWSAARPSPTTGTWLPSSATGSPVTAHGASITRSRRSHARIASWYTSV